MTSCIPALGLVDILTLFLIEMGWYPTRFSKTCFFSYWCSLEIFLLVCIKLDLTLNSHTTLCAWLCHNSMYLTLSSWAPGIYHTHWRESSQQTHEPHLQPNRQHFLPSWQSLWQNTTGDGVDSSNDLEKEGFAVTSHPFSSLPWQDLCTRSPPSGGALLGALWPRTPGRALCVSLFWPLVSFTALITTWHFFIYLFSLSLTKEKLLADCLGHISSEPILMLAKQTLKYVSS